MPDTNDQSTRDSQITQSQEAFEALKPVVDSLIDKPDINPQSLLCAIALHAICVIKRCEPQSEATEAFLGSFNSGMESVVIRPDGSLAALFLTKTKAPEPKP